MGRIQRLVRVAEGLRRYDLFGESHGFWRPGTSLFIEPRISYSRGHHTFSANVPLACYYNRHASPITGNPGDATFPRHILLSSYSIRLGRRGPAAAPPLTPATPRREPTLTPNPAPAAQEVWW